MAVHALRCQGELEEDDVYKRVEMTPHSPGTELHSTA